MSNNLVRLFLAVAVLSTFALAQAPAAAPAAPAGGTKIGIISIQEAVLASNEGQREFDALSKKFEPKRNELKSLNDEIESLKKQLQTQGDKMNEDARATLVKSIEAKQKTLSRTSEDAQNDFQAQQNDTFAKILQKMGPVIDKYAKDNSLGVIIDASRAWPEGPVLWANETVNITKPVVDAYNAQSGVAAPPASAPSATKPAATKPAGAAPAAAKPATPAPKPAAPATKPQ